MSASIMLEVYIFDTPQASADEHAYAPMLGPVRRGEALPREQFEGLCPRKVFDSFAEYVNWLPLCDPQPNAGTITPGITPAFPLFVQNSNGRRVSLGPDFSGDCRWWFEELKSPSVAH